MITEQTVEDNFFRNEGKRVDVADGATLGKN
jgi:hypothetical protein